VLVRLKPRIIHTRNLAALEMQAVGWLIPGTRRIHGEHGRDIYDLDGSNRRYRLLRRLLSPIIDRFITVSEDLRSWLVGTVGIPAEKVVQIYNGVDTDRFYPRATTDLSLAPKGFADPENIVIGTVGRLAEVKNQGSLVSAFASLVAESPSLRRKLRLVIVGDGPMHDALRRSIEDKAIGELVWLAGDRSDIPELLGMLDIFVLCSLAEGISNTILEAMASGLPIVATRTGGNPELVSDGYNGWLVPVSDSKALAATLRQMLENMTLARALGARGREIVDANFNWDRTVDSYLSVYDELLTAR
jgi:sugar transferase (PEP-CTERM/EpsH1 system associated)